MEVKITCVQVWLLLHAIMETGAIMTSSDFIQNNVVKVVPLEKFANNSIN